MTNNEINDVNTGKMIETFQNIINNPLTSKLLKSSLKYCDKCGKTQLESALDYYLGKQENICIKCKITYKIVKKVIDEGLKTFNTPEEALIQTMQNPYWEKGLISTIKGLAEFGVRRPFVPGAPYQIVWNITHACNFNCIHCYENAGKKDNNELSTEEIFDGIDKLANLGVAALAFSGGEPSIHPDINKIIKYAKDKGMHVSMATNGYIYSDYEKVQELKNLGLNFVQISLDGLNPKTHDEFRQVPGSWEHAVQAIKNFIKAGIYTGVSTTVTQKNKEEVPEMIKFLNDLGIDWFMLYNFIPTGKGSQISNIDLSPEERFELLNLIYTENINADINVMTTAPQFADVAIHTYDENQMIPTHFYNVNYTNPAMKQLAQFIGGCGAGRFYISMEPNGDIYPCVFFPHDKEVKLGNIKEDTLENLWIDNPLLKEFRDKDMLDNHCGSCESKYICGGCRARAYNYFGKITAPDPGCHKNLEAWNTLILEKQ